MKMSLEEVINEAALHGYNFDELLESYDSLCEKRNAWYGYALSEGKLAYLEAMADKKIDYCDKLHYFEDDLKEYLEEIKTIPHTKIISKFHILTDVTDGQGDLYDASLFRIVSINDDNKTAFLKDIEYSDHENCELYTVWRANLDYTKTIDMISLYGEDAIISRAEEVSDGFSIEDNVYIGERELSI